jgi:hypothetical protein
LLDQKETKNQGWYKNTLKIGWPTLAPGNAPINYISLMIKEAL